MFINDGQRMQTAEPTSRACARLSQTCYVLCNHVAQPHFMRANLALPHPQRPKFVSVVAICRRVPQLVRRMHDHHQGMPRT